MTVLIIALIVAAAAAGFLGWRCTRLTGELRRAQAQCRELQKDRGIRQNLQRICDSRAAEIRRLRQRVDDCEADLDALHERAAALNMNLFRESGLRILAEKEDGAKRMKMEQLEKQASDARRKLKTVEAQARETEKQLRDVIAKQEEELTKLKTPSAPRRTGRRAQQEAGALDQVTLEDVLGGMQSRQAQ